jgi:leader peptidase (prepilin peptidase)/N-methyltransferase
MWQYPAIELISAIVFALIAIRLLNYSEYSYWLALRDLILSASAIIIFIYDVKIRRIPDFVTLLAIILIIPTNLMAGSSPEMLLMGILAGSLFFGIQFLATQGKLVGGAEIRLGALVGASFGMIPAIITIGLAYLIAGIVGAYLVITKKADIYDSVPFGSFLAIAIIFMVIFENEMVNLYLKILGL